MKKSFWTAYLLLLLLQVLITNYVGLSPYLLLTILPLMVLCIPVRIKAPWAMLIAFATGLAVDFISEGVLGLNALALVPVAFVRIGVIKLLFGADLLARGEDFSVRRNGLVQVLLAILVCQGLFLLIYIWVDGASMRSFGFGLARFVVSLVCSTLVSLLPLNVLAPDKR